MTSADLVLLSGNILAMNPFQPHADAAAVKGNKILRVGTDAEISVLIGKDLVPHLDLFRKG